MSSGHTQDSILREPAEEKEGVSSSRDHLRRWLSVAESQLCAMEVLTGQVPKVNELLEGSMHDLGESFNTMAEHARLQPTHLEALTALADSVEHQDEACSIEELFVQFSEGKVSLDEAKSALKQRSQAIDSAIKEATLSSEKLLGAVSMAIVGMQFQDRVSQNLVIVVRVLDAVREYLQRCISATIHQLHLDDEKAHEASEVLDRDFAMQVLQLFTLGELQQKFVTLLIEKGYIDDASQLGVTQDNAAEGAGADDDDDIELF